MNELDAGERCRYECAKGNATITNDECEGKLAPRWKIECISTLLIEK